MTDPFALRLATLFLAAALIAALVWWKVHKHSPRNAVVMERFTTSIESSLEARNWFAALFMTLALPDICAALEDPDRPVGERYKDWFQRYLKPAYNPDSMYERMSVTAPEALERVPPESVESMKSQAPMKETAFTADDCYRLRCRCLHQGLPNRMGEDRIHFTAPDPHGRIHVHQNSFGGVLQIDIDQFCRDVVRAVLDWWSDARNDPDIAQRAEDLIKIYDLDAKELPIVSYGGD